MKYALGSLAALLCLAFLSVASVEYVSHPVASLFLSLALLGGAVTVTYGFPLTAAGTVAPTAAQMANASSLGFTVTATANGDATATITHNMGLTAAAIALFQPYVSIYGLTVNFWNKQWFVSSFTTNTMVLTNPAAAGADANPQLQGVILRPHTFMS